MFIMKHNNAYYLYFKFEDDIICIRFIPFINKFSEDKRRFAWWRINEKNKTN